MEHDYQINNKVMKIIIASLIQDPSLIKELNISIMSLNFIPLDKRDQNGLLLLHELHSLGMNNDNLTSGGILQHFRERPEYSFLLKLMKKPLPNKV